MQIPENYGIRMRQLLGDEYEAYLASLEEERVSSLRVNTARWSVAEALEVMGLPDRPVPWVPEGVYYDEECRPAKTVFWHAGLIYIQEASAMTPASVIPLKGDERVLDLCAAPGGKATQTAARLRDGGILYANDISASRAQALLKNLEMSGAGSIFVTAETPERLMLHFPEYFDAILVDAPCSGEGMIRKDSGMFRDWLARGPAYYQPIQAEILDQAEAMLKPGGMLLYSTCTFSREENEGNIQAFLASHDNMEMIPVPMREGFSPGLLPGTVRMWPHRTRGEGHFLALLHKKEAPDSGTSLPGTCVPPALAQGELPAWEPSSTAGRRRKGKGKRGDTERRGGAEAGTPADTSFPLEKECEDLLRGRTLVRREDCLYALPAGETIRSGLHYLRTGLLLGQWKKDRFLPSQHLAMALDGEVYPNRVRLPLKDERVLRYLRGETVFAEEEECVGEEGWVLVCAGRFPLGWAIRRGTGLKNKYTPGWRMIG